MNKARTPVSWAYLRMRVGGDRRSRGCHCTLGQYLFDGVFNGCYIEEAVHIKALMA